MLEPGWYPDPFEPTSGRSRYWSGTAWTMRTQEPPPEWSAQTPTPEDFAPEEAVPPRPQPPAVTMRSTTPEPNIVIPAAPPSVRVVGPHDLRPAVSSIHPSADISLRLRVIRLFEYLQAVRALREQPVRDIAAYQDRRWWAGDIPSHPACVVTATGEEPWLSVSKASVPQVPPPPAALVPHLQSPLTDPERDPTLVIDLDARLASDPGSADRVRAELNDYVERHWRPWSERARIAVAARRLYEDLYDLRLRLQRDDALIELVWGHGVLSWKVSGERVIHPMVTTRVRLTFDADSGDIRVVPDSLVGHIEIDLLHGLGIKGFDLLVDVRDRFRNEPIGPFDSGVKGLYQQIIQPLGLDGRVIDQPRPQDPTDRPTVTTGWCLFVRRRSTLYQRFFVSLRDGLANETLVVPAALGAIVADEPSRLDDVVDGVNGDDWKAVAERLLMPLPTNPEQEQVARRLAEHRGVTVQGPPGTGKTHTIANLVSHLVGHGKTVLVTSQKEQALSVVRGQNPRVPPGPVGRGAWQLRSIPFRSSTNQSRRSTRRPSALTEARPGCSWRASERSSTKPGGRSPSSAPGFRRPSGRERDTYAVGTATHTPSTLGEWLARTQPELGFVPDQIPPDAPCPLNAGEVADLYAFAARLAPQDCEQARLYLPPADQLPSASDLATDTAELRELRDRLADDRRLT